MTITEIKKELHQFVDNADEDLLKAVYEILKAANDTDDFEISDEHKRILDERLKAYHANPTDVITWEEIKVKYGKP